jgi:exosortase
MSVQISNRSQYSIKPKTLVIWSIVTILLLVLYADVIQKWGYDIWTDSNYSHGMLIPFVSLYLIYQRFVQLREAQSTSCNIGLLFILPALLLFVLGSVAGEQFSQRVSFVILLYGLVLFLEGKEKARLLLFPIALFLFAIPLPYILYNAIAFPLKLIATKIAAAVISLFGMPVFRDGNVIHLPHTTLEVVDACSGIRSLMTLITLAFLLASFQLRSFWKQALLVLLALPIAVAANAGRVALTGLLTKSNPAWGSGTLHEITGWGVFVISFGFLLGISFLMERQREKRVR